MAGLFSSGTTPEQAWMMAAKAFPYFLANGKMAVLADAAHAAGEPVEMTTFENKAGEMVTQPKGWANAAPATSSSLPSSNTWCSARVG